MNSLLRVRDDGPDNLIDNHTHKEMMMNKHTTHLTWLAVLALLTLTVSFAGWRAHAAYPRAAAPPAPAMFATFTVTNTNDSGAGSLRQAILDSNASVGVFDTIDFALGAGTPTINLLSGLPGITDPVTINGNTGGSTRVELNGAALPFSAGLVISAGNSTIAGLVINRFGGSGIIIQANGGNTIRNCYIGTDATGTMGLGNGQLGIILSSANNTIGGTSEADRNVISGNNQGISIEGAGNGNRVIGNYIGIDATGTVRLNNFNGVLVYTANNIIGGTTVGERNVISGNVQRGVWLNGAAATGNQVLGNYIGTDATGMANLGNGAHGVEMGNGASNNLVGGTNPAASNLIAYNSWGVLVDGGAASTGNVILGNSIFSNRDLGIGLGGTRTPNINDAGDGDTGPNNLQNYPVLTCMTNVGGVTTINGTFNSLATTAFRIEYFLNDTCDNATSNGEGQTFITAQTVTTDASGNAALTLVIAPPIAVGKVLTATATLLDGAGNPVETSEFSKCLLITAPPTLTISDVTRAEGNAGTKNFVFNVTLAGAQNWCSPVTVNYATADGTATAGSDYTATGGTLMFAPPHASNSVTQTITVPVMGDTTIEPNETFFVNLSGATNATISDNQGLGTITNDDNTVAPALTAQIGDPLLCLTAGGLVGVTATVTNPNAFAVNANFTATLPTTLNGLPGTGRASVNPGGVVVTASAVTWTGTIPANTTVTITYKTQLAADAPPNTPICVNSEVVFNGGPRATVQECKVLGCPAGPVNAQVSDQKAGAVLVFPYYVSKAADRKDTRLTLSNIGDATAQVHLFFIDGTTCAQADQYLCLTPNASFSLKASEYDPEATGWLLAVAVGTGGRPTQYNGLVGNAFVNDGEYVGNYGAETFRANSALLATLTGNTATLYFDQQSYDAVPNQFAVEIQSPQDAVGQRVVTVGLRGDLTTSAVTGAAQVGTGLVTNGSEKPFGSFSAWLLGNCQAQAMISTTAPRVPNGMAVMIPTGQVGSMKWSIGGGVGLLMTPRTAAWRGIRTLHKTGLTATTLTIPVLAPVC